MTQILLPSPVGLCNGRLWPTKIKDHIDSGKDLYHRRENSRQMRFLQNGPLYGVKEYFDEKRAKNIAKCEVHIELGRRTNISNASVNIKQDIKPCTRTQQAQHLMFDNPVCRSASRNLCNVDDKPLVSHVEAVNQLSTAVQCRPAVGERGLSTDNDEEIDLRSKSRKSAANQKTRSARIDNKNRESDVCQRRRSVRQAERRESTVSSNETSAKNTESQTTTNCDATADYVAVPTWRVIEFSRFYKIEGTENLTDEAFLKRHQRFEADEKRRKRWDLQRQRELSLYESARRDDNHLTTCNDGALPSSPSSTDVIEVAYVEVLEDGMSAFTAPLPALKQKEFKLPWPSDAEDHSVIQPTAKRRLSKSTSRGRHTKRIRRH